MRAFVLALLVVVPAALAGCAADTTEAADVMTTFYPLGFLAERISNGTVRVATLVPSGIEPHAWEPSASDVARAGNAKLFLAQGAGFEPWIGTLRTALGDRAPTVVELTAGLPLKRGGEHAHAHEDEAHEGEAHEEETHEGEAHEEEAHEEPGHEGAGNDTAHEGEGPFDPHTWLDPVLFSQQADRAAEAMAAAFPQHAEAFRANLALLKADLSALDREYQAGLASCGTRTIIANHDAYTYLASRYGFEVVSISGLSPEVEPSPQAMARAVDEARAHNATIIFFEELVSARVAEVVAREVGAQTRVLSPLEGLTAEQRAAGADYVSVMRENLASLREAMRCA